MKKERHNTFHIKDIIKKIRKQGEFVNLPKVSRIEPVVKNFLPEKFHSYLGGVNLRGKKLTIKIINNSALMELDSFYKEPLLNFLNNNLPESYRIKNIVFKNV
ncbi:MAG: hypothetical protein ACK4NF_05740 [Planctomycetota bacterium]